MGKIKNSNYADKFHKAMQASRRAANLYARPRNNMGTLHRRNK